MTLETSAPAPQNGWWPIAAHILKRVLLVVLAYLVAVLVTLIAVVVIYSVLSNLRAAPAYFGAFNFRRSSRSWLPGSALSSICWPLSCRRCRHCLRRS